MSPTRSPSLFRLSLLHGSAIGLALAVGLWLPELIRLWGTPLRHLHPTLLLSSLGFLVIGGLAGALSAWLTHSALSALLWLLAGWAVAWLLGGLLTDVQTLAAWLGDLRFWGIPVYPANASSQLQGGVAGFFVVLLLAVYGLLQRTRLESLGSEQDSRGRLTGRGWFLLALGLLPVVAVGVIADEIVLKPIYAGPRVVDQAIRVVRTTTGDLFDLSQRDGINYNALKGVRDGLDGGYTLQIGQVERGPVSTIFVVAEFENGLWLLCRLMGESLSHCADPSPPYLTGFPSLLATGHLSEECPACRFRVNDSQLAWLAERRSAFADQPAIARVRQMGDVVLMEARSSSEPVAIRCFFKGFGPIVLESCGDD